MSQHHLDTRAGSASAVTHTSGVGVTMRTLREELPRRYDVEIGDTKQACPGYVPPTITATPPTDSLIGALRSRVVETDGADTPRHVIEVDVLERSHLDEVELIIRDETGNPPSAGAGGGPTGRTTITTQPIATRQQAITLLCKLAHRLTPVVRA